MRVKRTKSLTTKLTAPEFAAPRGPRWRPANQRVGRERLLAVCARQDTEARGPLVSEILVRPHHRRRTSSSLTCAGDRLTAEDVQKLHRPRGSRQAQEGAGAPGRGQRSEPVMTHHPGRTDATAPTISG